MKHVVLIAGIFLMLGCTDKAEPDYKQCVADEASGDVLAAERACKRALFADEKSASVKAAAEKLKAMQPAIEKANQAKAEADAAAAKELKKKVKKSYWGGDTDGECTGKGLPPYRWTYEGGTFAEDQEVAESDGCAKLHQTVELQDYCCPQRPILF